MAAKAEKDPRIQRIVADAQMFDSLRENTGWRRLYERVAAQKDRFLLSLARRLMAGDTPSPEEIAYERGFYMGAIYVLEHPKQAMESLERAARHAWVLAQEELLAAGEEESPYA